MTVALVATGGTIASTPDEDGESRPALSGADLVDAVPGLDRRLRIEEFDSLPSSRFTVGRMWDLLERVRDLDADPDVSGVVVTQGTDTLEEVAAFVDLCYGGDTPLVFTGAMRTPDAAGADGPANLLAAVRVAGEDRARGAGALVAFSDRVFDAREVLKVHARRVDAFRAPEFGPLGAVEEGRVVWRRDPPARASYDPDPDALTSDVHAVTATVHAPAAQIRAAADADGLVLAATGAGNVPPTALEALPAVREAGVPVVVTSRCPQGRIGRSNYAGGRLAELGCLVAQRPLATARVATVVGIAADVLDRIFERPDAVPE